MADVTIYGMPQSTYTRTCRMVCEEKGIAYDYHGEVGPHSPEILALSPTGKVPAFQHGDLTLWETSAIAHYLEDTFDGAALVPGDATARAHMNIWLGMLADWMYQTMIRDIVLPRFGLTEADDAKLAAAAETFDRQLTVIDDQLQKTTFLAGDQVTLADLYLAPIVFWLGMTPEGQAGLPKYAALQRWYAAIAERPSFQNTIPPIPGQDG